MGTVTVTKCATALGWNKLNLAWLWRWCKSWPSSSFARAGPAPSSVERRRATTRSPKAASRSDVRKRRSSIRRMATLATAAAVIAATAAWMLQLQTEATPSGWMQPSYSSGACNIPAVPGESAAPPSGAYSSSCGPPASFRCKRVAQQPGEALVPMPLEAVRPQASGSSSKRRSRPLPPPACCTFSWWDLLASHPRLFKVISTSNLLRSQSAAALAQPPGSPQMVTWLKGPLTGA
mmetsp:Transcript_53050/g.154366  ORF Transcript_53050/g.154366 Transcript_53050/m.154366 type:complete len:235 (-) Transcript_53050:395-1099(-)